MLFERQTVFEVPAHGLLFILRTIVRVLVRDTKKFSWIIVDTPGIY